MVILNPSKTTKALKDIILCKFRAIEAAHRHSALAIVVWCRRAILQSKPSAQQLLLLNAIDMANLKVIN